MTGGQGDRGVGFTLPLVSGHNALTAWSGCDPHHRLDQPVIDDIYAQRVYSLTLPHRRRKWSWTCDLLFGLAVVFNAMYLFDLFDLFDRSKPPFQGTDILYLSALWTTWHLSLRLQSIACSPGLDILLRCTRTTVRNADTGLRAMRRNQRCRTGRNRARRRGGTTSGSCISSQSRASLKAGGIGGVDV
jgi:hypothetical protein